MGQGHVRCAMGGVTRRMGAPSVGRRCRRARAWDDRGLRKRPRRCGIMVPRLRKHGFALTFGGSAAIRRVSFLSGPIETMPLLETQTRSLKPAEVQKAWVVVDAEGLVLG